MRGRRTRGRTRPETPQEARQRMMDANRQGSDAPAPSSSSLSPPSGEARPGEPEAPARRPFYEETTAKGVAQAESRTPNGARRWEGAPAVEREEPGRPPEPDPGRDSGSDAKDAPVGELVKQLTEQTKTLVKQEMRLAQVELQEKGKKVGLGAGLFGAGGLVGFFGGAVLIAAIVLALDTALAAWLAALIVAVLLLVGAGIAALLGKKQIEKATPPAPEAAMESVKQDVDTVKQAARS